MLFSWFNESKVLLVSLVSGFFLFVFAVLIYSEIPSDPILTNHSNLNSTLLSLQFSKSIEDIRNIIGGPEHESHYEKINKLKYSVLLDYYYILFYFIFMVSVLEYVHLKNRILGYLKPIFYLALLVAIGFDFYENIKILGVLNSKSEVSIKSNLEYLREINLLKWLCVFIATSIIGLLGWLNRHNVFLKICGLFLFTSFTIALTSYYKLYLIEVAIGMMIFGYGLMYIFLFFQYYPSLKRLM